VLIFFNKVSSTVSLSPPHNMQHSLLCLFLISTITVTQSFIHPFLVDDSAVFPVLPNASRRFHLSRTALYPDGGESPPPATWSKLNNTPVLSRITRNEINTRRVENMLTDFFSALIHADDCTLLERQTQGMGSVYLDTNFSMSRKPLLLRTGVREIMSKYNLPLRPVERKWTPSPYNESTPATET
jgi:hypothetical protein